MLYYSTNTELHTKYRVINENRRKAKAAAACIAEKCIAKVIAAIEEYRTSIWEPYNNSDPTEHPNTDWSVWASQLERKCEEAVPSIIQNVVSHYMCGDANLIYKPTPLYREVCKIVAAKLNSQN